MMEVHRGGIPSTPAQDGRLVPEVRAAAGVRVSKALSRSDLVLGSVLALVVLAFGRVYAGFVQDDAYITYRYARNIASGAGFVYNEGEYVLGTSTPLYALTLALLGTLTRRPVPEIGIAVGLVSLWAAGVAIYGLGKDRAGLAPAAASLVFLTNPFLRHMIGMETFFLLAIFLLATWAFVRERLAIASILLGALVLVRYEMLFYPIFLALVALLRTRRSPVWLWPSVPMVVAWVTYAALRFGSPIPLSASAKVLSDRVPFALGFLFYDLAIVKEVAWWGFHAILLTIGVVAMLVRKDAPRAYGLLVLWGVLYFVLVSPIAGSFPWYYGPLLPSIAVGTAWGAASLSAIRWGTTRGYGGAPKPRQGPFLLVSAGLLLANLAFWVRDWSSYRGGAFDHRLEAFRQASTWLLDHSASGATLAASEIGYVGYFTNMRILDLYGLVTPGVHRWLAKGLDFTTARAIEAYSPDYFLVQTSVAPLDLDVLNKDYSVAAVIDARYLIYERTTGSK
jgi:hypothetical protein